MTALKTSPSGIFPGQTRRRVRLLLLASAAAFVLGAGGGPGPWSQILVAPAHAQEASGGKTAGPQGFAALAARVTPAVISVRVRIAAPADETLPIPHTSPFYRFFHGQGGSDQQEIITGEGSGFFISADGYAVTNNHVVAHAKSVQVTTTDGTIYTAKVVGTDPQTDVALIKVDAGNKQFPFVKFADHQAKVGEWVLAVGNPFGLGGTVTAGIVSARGRDIGASPYDDYIQIDAPINKGNSGGPAFDESGDVIGVNTAIYSPSGGSVGIGFDIPADTVRMVVDQLKSKGYVTRGWMGVQVQPVTAAIADSLGLNKAQGALVDEPQPGSPAAKADIHAGDVITAVNGESIKDARMLAQKVAMTAPGTSVELSVWRDGQTKKVQLTLATMPRHQQQANNETEGQQSSNSEPHLGMRIAPAQDVEGAGDRGVVVLNVDPNGAAAQNGIQSGDVILDAGGKPVEKPADLRQAIDHSRSEGRHSILMRLRTADGTRFVAVPIGQG